MSYNIASSGTLNASASNFKIASDAYVSYTPDYQSLLINGNGANYGICYTGLTVDSGGYLNMGNRAYVSSLTVLSGGTAVGASWAAWRDLTVSSGGSVTFLAGKLHGNINIAQGAITNDADAYAVNGVFYNFDHNLNFDIFNNVVFSNCSLGGTIWVCEGGAALRDVTVLAGGVVYAYNAGGTFYNLTVTAGKFTAYSPSVNFTFGGSKTEIAAGHWTNNASLYVTSGVIYNMNLRNEGSNLQKITLTEGIVANAPVVGNSGVLTIGSAGSATGATVTSNGNLYVSANGEVRNTVVSSSGKAFLNSGARSYDAVVSNGGKLTVSVGAVASGVTVSEGGTVAYTVSSWYRPDIIGLVVESGGSATTENYVPWRSLDVKEGGYFSNTNAIKIYGNNINIASGAWVNCPTAYVSNGAITNYSGTLIFDVYEGAVISSSILTNYAYLLSGGSAKDVTVANGGQVNVSSGAFAGAITVENGGKLHVSHGAVTDGITVKAGGSADYNVSGYTRPDIIGLVVESGGTVTAANYVAWRSLDVEEGGYFSNTNAVKIYGKNINIASGAWVNCPTAFVSGGIITNYSGTLSFDVYDGAGFSSSIIEKYVYLFSGTTATDVTVANGGQLNVSSGALTDGITVENGGQLNVSYGALTDAITVENGGRVNYVANGGNRPDINGLVISSGGVVSADGYCGWRGIDASSGAILSAGNVKIYGSNINIASGAWVNCPTAYAINGVIYDLDTTSGGNGIDLYGSAVVSNAKLGGYTYLFSGAQARDAELTNAARGLEIRSGCYGYNINATVGKIYFGEYWTNVSLGGAETEIAAGHVFYNGAGAATAPDANLYATSGVLHNLVLRGSGSWMQNLTLIEGITADAPVMSGGSLTIASAATVNDLVLSSGNIMISSGGVLNGVTQSDGLIRMESGAAISHVDLVDGRLHLFDYPDVTGMERAAMTADDVTMSNGMLFLRGTNVSGSDITVRGGIAYIQNGAIADGVNVSGGVVSVYLQTASGCVDNNVFGATVKNAILTDGEINVTDGGVADNVTVEGGQLTITGLGNAFASGVTVTGGNMSVGAGRVADLNVVAGGELTLGNGFTFEGDINFAEGTLTNDADAKAASGVIEDFDLAINGNFGSGITLSNFTQTAAAVNIMSGAAVETAAVTGGTLNISSGAAVNGITAAGGKINVISGATMSNGSVTAGSLTVFESAGVSGFEQTGGRVIVYGTDAVISGTTVYGGNMSVGNGGALNDATISGGTVVVRHVAGWAYNENLTATASDVRIEDGAALTLESGGILQAGKLANGANLTVYKGGQASLSSAAAGATIDLSFWDVNSGGTVGTDGLIADWGDFSADAQVNIHSIDFGGTSYKIADVANANVTLDVIGYHDIYQIAVKSGKQHSNAFWGMNFDFSDGMTLSTDIFSVGVETTAAALGTGTATALADGGFAAIWTADTDTSNVSVVADANTTGDAWVTINCATLATPLYGAQGNFTHDVNMWIYEGTVKNLAAGATAGGSVENVNLLISDHNEGTDKLNFTGVAYLGGFGSVAGEVTAAVYGGTYDKDFYAGALANKLSAQTSVGGVNLTVTGGLFKGNLYGASAVKTVEGTGAGIRNTTGNVNLTIAGGEADKSDFCAFAGGYATGTATGTVYTVDSVNAAISGGSWGEAKGGRGIFGGIYASQVTAEAGDVNLTVSGGTTGNVYGGGWAQKGGSSIVGDVNISISGGTITNVFGGGSHSTSGGSTTAGAVTITVSGGSITGAIYARGQLENDAVASAEVIFTGTTDFGCGVFGYSYVGGAESDATLCFTGYTGEFAGAIGGFDGITFAGTTAMTLSTLAADVSNGAWEFDLTDRANTLAGTSLLTWSGANFENDTIKVSFADDTQAQGGWNIATVAEAFSGTTFEVEIGGSEIATGLNYSQQISDGDYQGWGFELESGVLKFKQLA